MLFFKCLITYNELVALNLKLPPGSFCITKLAINNIHYGVVLEDVHGDLIEILSGETLSQLEYMDKQEFKEVVVSPMIEEERIAPHFFGNAALITQSTY